MSATVAAKGADASVGVLTPAALQEMCITENVLYGTDGYGAACLDAGMASLDACASNEQW